MHCATFNQNALRRHGLHEDATPSSRVDSSEKGLMVVMFCSDLSEKDVKKIVSFITPAFVLDAVCESL